MISPTRPEDVIDPIAFAERFWPHVTFYDKQLEVIYSVRDDDETVVPAGNMLGKDFVAGFIALWFFCSRNPCRVMTTSAKDQHLDVLWGEIGSFLQSASPRLETAFGGSLLVHHRKIRKIVQGEMCKKSKLEGMVASQDSIASMQGYHIADVGDKVPRTLFICDESSSVLDDYYTMASGWMHRALIIGNPWPCNNFFYRAVKGNLQTDDPGGTLPRDSGKGNYRRVIKITAEDSPNIKWARSQIERGLEPDGEVIIPGVKGYDRYRREQKLWDDIQKCVSHDAEFYEGVETWLFPLEKIKASIARAESLRGTKRSARTIGIDPAEGGDNTVWTVGDELGFIYQRSMRTADTSKIVDITLGLMREYKIAARNVLFDRGGGGKEHADRLRRMGYNVRTIAFGESVIPEKKRGITTLERRKLQDEERYAYYNRRAEMYGLLSRAIDPEEGEPYAIPRGMSELCKQLQPIPKIYDKEGRLWLPPKNKPPGVEKSLVKTLIEMIGHSPDEADSAVLCYYGLVKKTYKSKAGVL